MLRDIVQSSASTIPMKQDSNGIFLFLDSSRSKYLSSSRENFSFGINHRNINASRWLRTTGDIPSNVNGYLIPRNATITSVSIQLQNTTTNSTIYIRKNKVLTTIVPIPLISTDSSILDNLNIDLNSGDYLQAYLSISSGNVDYPLLNLEIAWRE